MALEWYFDFISPFAYLQWPRIRELAIEREVRLRPILFAGLLDVLGTKGPAEIAPKRRFIYRFVQWRAAQLGLTLKFPPAHPFNPLPALRLAIAAGTTPRTIDAIFKWIWVQGEAADSIPALQPLAAGLGIEDLPRALADAAVKQQLRDNFEAARANGVFGVPTLLVDAELFWGEDATAFALARIADPGLFDRDPYPILDALPTAAVRPGAGH